MKRFKLLIAMMVISCCAFSQNLKPIVQVVNDDTLFCFSIPQSKELAKLVVKGVYNDSLAHALGSENRRLYALLEGKDQVIHNLDVKQDLTHQMAENHKENLRSIEGILEVRNKELKQKKRDKRWMAVGLVGLAIISVTR